ncbi:NUDIX hydrolase [Erythrobacter sp. HA6-11]
MLRLIPKPLHRAFYRVAHKVRTYYWRITRPTIHGCAMIAQNDAGEILLVRPSYGKRLWQWPGGGVAEHEDVVSAASREVVEETGLQVEGVRSLGETRKLLYGATNVVHVFAGSATGRPSSDEREIEEAGWFAPDRLPNRRSIYVDEYLINYRGSLRP